MRRFISFFLGLIFLTGCTSAFDRTDYSYKEYKHYFGITLPPADVYLRFPATMNVRNAHKKLITSSKEFVKKKCGQTQRYKFHNFKIYPTRWAGMYMTYPVISADIVCNPNGSAPAAIFSKMSVADATKECLALGFQSDSSGMDGCISELTSD